MDDLTQYVLGEVRLSSRTKVRSFCCILNPLNRPVIDGDCPISTCKQRAMHDVAGTGC